MPMVGVSNATYITSGARYLVGSTSVLFKFSEQQAPHAHVLYSLNVLQKSHLSSLATVTSPTATTTWSPVLIRRVVACELSSPISVLSIAQLGFLGRNSSTGSVFAQLWL
jgi:hypothetical protein